MQRKPLQQKTTQPVDPRSILGCAIYIGICAALHWMQGEHRQRHFGILFPILYGLIQLGWIGWQYARESRRQPDRSLEFSLAANAMLLLLPGGALYILDIFPAIAGDLIFGGCLLAVAATGMDQFTRWDAKRQTAAATVYAVTVTSAQSQQQAPVPTVTTIPVASGTPQASQTVVVGAPRRN